MQTRLPREEWSEFVGQILVSLTVWLLSLVRDPRGPRAVFSSLISMLFLKEKVCLLRSHGLLKEYFFWSSKKAQIRCSLVTENLDQVNSEWANWFKSHSYSLRRCHPSAIFQEHLCTIRINSFRSRHGRDHLATDLRVATSVSVNGMVLSNTDAATIGR